MWSHILQVERRHLEAAVDESIKTLDIADGGGPGATSDDLQVCEKPLLTVILYVIVVICSVLLVLLLLLLTPSLEPWGSTV